MSNQGGYFKKRRMPDKQDSQDCFIIRFDERSELCVKLRREKVDQIILTVRRQYEECYYEETFSRKNIPTACLQAFESVEGLFYYIQDNYKKNMEIEYAGPAQCCLFLKDSIGKRPKTYQFIIKRQSLGKYERLKYQCKEMALAETMKMQNLDELIGVISIRRQLLDLISEENRKLCKEHEEQANERESIQESIHVLNQRQVARARSIQDLKKQQEMLTKQIEQLSKGQLHQYQQDFYQVGKPPSKKGQSDLQVHPDDPASHINQQTQENVPIIFVNNRIQAESLELDPEDVESQFQPEPSADDDQNPNENIDKIQRKSSIKILLIQNYSEKKEKEGEAQVPINQQNQQTEKQEQEQEEEFESSRQSEDSNKQNVPIAQAPENPPLVNQQAIEQAINFTFAPKKMIDSNLLEFSQILTDEVPSHSRMLQEINNCTNPNISDSFMLTSGFLQSSDDEDNFQNQFGKKIKLNFSHCHNIKDYELTEVQNNERVLKMVSKEGVFSYLYHKRSLKGLQFFVVKIESIRHNDFDFGIRGYDSLNVPRIEWHENIVCFAGSIFKLVNRCLFRDLSSQYQLRVGDEVIVSVDMDMRKFRISSTASSPKKQLSLSSSLSNAFSSWRRQRRETN